MQLKLAEERYSSLLSLPSCSNINHWKICLLGYLICITLLVGKNEFQAYDEYREILGYNKHFNEAFYMIKIQKEFRRFSQYYQSDAGYRVPKNNSATQFIQ